MSMSPQQMQQLLAMYKQQFPNGAQPAPLTPQQQQLQGINQVTAGLGPGTPAGTNRTAGGVNGAAQLIAALMKAQKQKQIQQQLQPQQPSTAPQNFTGNTDMGAASTPNFTANTDMGGA